MIQIGRYHSGKLPTHVTTLHPPLDQYASEVQVNDGDAWASNCAFFQTIMSNAVDGIECDATRIHDNAHSYPKKPGNVVASFMYTLAWEEVSHKCTRF